MAIEFISWALQQRIPSGPKFVLVALANRCNQDGECWPSQDDITAQTSFSLSSVKRNIKWLTRQGFLQKETRRRANGSFTSDKFRLGIFPAAEPSRGAPGAKSTLGQCDLRPEVTVTPGDSNISPASNASETKAEPELQETASSENRNQPGVTVTYPEPSLIETSLLEPSPPRARTKTSPPPIPIPDWLPAGLWKEYLQHRKELSPKPFTPTAQRNAIGRLKTLRDAGDDPADVIRQTLENNWTGLFKLKTLEKNYGKNTNRTDAISSALDEGYRRMYGTAPGSSQDPQRLVAAVI